MIKKTVLKLGFAILLLTIVSCSQDKSIEESSISEVLESSVLESAKFKNSTNVTTLQYLNEANLDNNKELKEMYDNIKTDLDRRNYAIEKEKDDFKLNFKSIHDNQKNIISGIGKIIVGKENELDLLLSTDNFSSYLIKSDLIKNHLKLDLFNLIPNLLSEISPHEAKKTEYSKRFNFFGLSKDDRVKVASKFAAFLGKGLEINDISLKKKKVHINRKPEELHAYTVELAKEEAKVYVLNFLKKLFEKENLEKFKNEIKDTIPETEKIFEILYKVVDADNLEVFSNKFQEKISEENSELLKFILDNREINSIYIDLGFDENKRSRFVKIVFELENDMKKELVDIENYTFKIDETNVTGMTETKIKEDESFSLVEFFFSKHLNSGKIK